MTKKKSKGRRIRRVLKREATTGRWMLHEAKTRFSEVVRRANTVGPQRVSVHGRNEVVIMSAGEYARLKGEHSGRLLVDLMRKSPLRDVEIEPPAERSPVRDVEL
jgi:prevent-host-death family protein